MRIKLFGLLVVSSSYGVRIRRVERDVIAQLIGAGWTEAPDCAPGHYPSWDCQSFYQCDHGYRSPDRPCAPGTLYNAALQTCDHAENNDDTENTCEIGDPPLGNLGINLERVHY